MIVPDEAEFENSEIPEPVEIEEEITFTPFQAPGLGKDITLEIENNNPEPTVETSEEYIAGHLKGAQNIDIRQSDAYSKLDKLNPKTTYLVYCRTNHRSGMAVDYMMQKGFKSVYQMMDGFPGWAANNFAYEK